MEAIGAAAAAVTVMMSVKDWLKFEGEGECGRLLVERKAVGMELIEVDGDVEGTGCENEEEEESR